MPEFFRCDLDETATRYRRMGTVDFRVPLISMTMLTWYEGNLLKRKRIQHGKQSIEDFIRHLDSRKTKRIPGTAIYMTSNAELTRRRWRFTSNIIIRCMKKSSW